MQNDSSNRWPIGRLAGASFALTFLTSAVPALQTPIPSVEIEPKPIPPAAMLYEVCFDALGTDGSAGNGEWVELYTSKAIDLAGWSLRTNQGNVLYTFGLLSVPKYSTVMILFSDQVTFPLDTDPSDGRVAVAANLPLGDYLGNASGGVRLVNPSGQIKDALYWGTGTAPAGAPRGQWFDLAFNGGKPMGEGDTLGRPGNPYTGYTGKIGDWERHGGINSLQATPGGRNGIDVYNFAGMLGDTQAGIVDILLGFSDQVEPDRISVDSAGVTTTAVAQTPTSLSLIATHTFGITDNGVPGTLSGSVSTGYVFSENPDNVSYSLTVSGTLSSTTGFAIDVDYTVSTAGAHTNVPSKHSQTDVTWYENSQAYPYSIVADVSSARTGQDTWEFVDSRTIDDFGGAGTKTADTTTTFTRLSDGVYQIVSDMTRSFPIQMPPLWAAGTQTLNGTEASGMTHTQTTLSNGDFFGTVTRYDYSVNGSLWRTLDAGKSGTYSATADLANSTSTTVARVYDSSLPVLFFGSPMTITLHVDAFDSIANGKAVSSATREVKFDGFTYLSGSATVDPPLAAFPAAPAYWQQDPNPQSPTNEQPKEDEGFLDAVTTCSSRGAAVGGSGGAVVGGVIGAGAGAVAVPGLGSVPGWVAGGTAGAGIGAAGGTLVGGIWCGVSWFFD